mmetsp:Transcript_17947/g.51719  ORF Transcript_17947/g.51719 Transcript_17947/m.51719 type:complete len:215 (-) Transcript_17947:980-1624(-)
MVIISSGTSYALPRNIFCLACNNKLREYLWSCQIDFSKGPSMPPSSCDAFSAKLLLFGFIHAGRMLSFASPESDPVKEPEGAASTSRSRFADDHGMSRRRVLPRGRRPSRPPLGGSLEACSSSPGLPRRHGGRSPSPPPAPVPRGPCSPPSRRPSLPASAWPTSRRSPAGPRPMMPMPAPIGVPATLLFSSSFALCTSVSTNFFAALTCFLVPR